jgi:hypothetical protein
VDDSLGVHGLERGGELADQGEGQTGGQVSLAGQPIAQRLTAQVLHLDEEGAVAQNIGVVDLHQAWVRHLGERVRLVAVAAARLLLFGLAAKGREHDLDGHALVDALVLSQKDRAHATAVDELFDLVAADLGADQLLL